MSIFSRNKNSKTEIKFRKLSYCAHEPSRGSDQAAGYDLYADIDEGGIVIQPHTTEKIPTGIAVALPDNTFGAIFARSGLASKKGLRPANCVGVVDSDYRGEVIVALHNDSDDIAMIGHGERIAQLVVIPYLAVNFVEADELDDTIRGDGGFGSTGTN